MSEPLRIKVADERQAVAVAHELLGLTRLEVRPDATGWEVSLEGATTERFVCEVLTTLRRTLAGQPTSVVRVLLDGREYRMQGE